VARASGLPRIGNAAFGAATSCARIWTTC